MVDEVVKPKFNLPGGENTRAGIGRPTGSVNIASKRAAKKLEELGFDPIEKMIQMYHKLTIDIDRVQNDEDGNPREKFSALALANLMSAQQRCIDTLMRYGYARVTEGVEVTQTKIAPVTIQLSSATDKFDTSVLGAVPLDDNENYKGEDE
jgi:hypothetical protein